MTYKPVNRDDEIRNDVMADPEARAIYEATKLQIDIAMTLKNARKKQNLTQEEVAELMHTHKPVISRLESGNADVKHFPSLLTIVRFASAVGYELKIGFVPLKCTLKSQKRRRILKQK